MLSLFFHLLFVSSLVQFNVCIRPSPKFPSHLIIALVNILGTSYECERNTEHTYTSEEEEEKTSLCNPLLLTNCLTCVYACSKHISSILLLQRTLELEHSLFFVLTVKNTHIHFQRLHASVLLVIIVVRRHIENKF